MKTVAQLNQTDIIQIIANYFNVDINKVHFSCYKDYEGIGPMEHEVSKAKAEVEISVDF